MHKYVINPLGPHNDQHQISPHHISALKHIQLMRIREMITKDGLDVSTTSPN